MFYRRSPLAVLILTLISLVEFEQIGSVGCTDDRSVLVDRFSKQGLTFVSKHCLVCHGKTEPKGDFSLIGDDNPAAVIRRRSAWENVVEMVTSGQMPPSERPRPDQLEVESFVSTINSLFDDADTHAKPDPGYVTVRRLNRTEYNNTVRDLMYIDFDVAEDFPSDDVGYGFDNIGDVLTMSPVLMDRYLAAAEASVTKAIIVGKPPAPPQRRTKARALKTTNSKEPRVVEFRSLISTGKISANHKLRVDGEYAFRFRGWGRQVGNEPVKVAFLIDDKIIDSIDVTSTEENKKIYDAKPVRLGAGEHTIAVSFLNEFTDSSADKPELGQRTLCVEFCELEGPLELIPYSHKTLLACRLDQSKREQAVEVLSRFLSRAYRRRASAEEVDRLVDFTMRGIDDGLSWEAALQRSMAGVLVSPKFLFRLELDNRPDSLEPRALDQFQLASRMSYFLWSTMPDEELFQLALQGTLINLLDAQVRRMLSDPKSIALVTNFGLQWLQLTRLKEFSPDQKLFPAFNEQLREAMLVETELFLSAIVHEDRRITDLLDADFTFVNQQLAELYGLEAEMAKSIKAKPLNYCGPNKDFVRVDLRDKSRGGLLTQASVLTATSNPTRTSPVKRGRWILDQILGAPPPPPPPNVPNLAEGDQAKLTGSLRQRMEQHRANPACATCHARMDPLGFALENYNAIGAFRSNDGDFPIDANGVLPGGKQLNGAIELKSILKDEELKVRRNLIQKLMTYGLGRGLEYYDRPAIVRILEAVKKKDDHFSTLVIEIVKSDPFRMRRGQFNQTK